MPNYMTRTCEECEGDYSTGGFWNDEQYCRACHIRIMPAEPKLVGEIKGRVEITDDEV